MSVIVEMAQADLSEGTGISEMIGFSVRLAVPFIFLAMAASSFQTLFPGRFARWWLRNRRYIGLCFAVGMAWQALFILIVSTLYRPYYLEEIYYFRDELEGSVGYLFMVAMVATSFKFGRSRLNQTQWKIIQKGGIYFLWGYAFSVYWWNLFYYGDPRLLDYIYYAGGFFAFSLRIAAWTKNRQKNAMRTAPSVHPTAMARVCGTALVVLGLVVALTGGLWQKAMTGFVTAPTWSAQMELWLPFWPLEPFYSLLLIAAGATLLSPSSNASSAPAKLVIPGQ